MPLPKVVVTTYTHRCGTAGLLGGLTGFVLSEGFSNDNAQITDSGSLRTHAALLFAIVVAAIGAAILMADRRRHGRRLATTDDVATIAVLLIIGVATGFIAQVVYEKLLPDFRQLDCIFERHCVPFQQRIARTIGWGIAGVGTGLGVGWGCRSRDRLPNITLGGLAGGLVGGFLFDFIQQVVGYDEPTWSRAVAISFIGLLIGIAVATVEQIRSSGTPLTAPTTYATGGMPPSGRIPPPPPRPKP